MSELRNVRPATAADKEPILSFCRNTFSWGDYIDVVWDQWLADPNGQILAGVMDGKPVAVAHVALLGDGIAWMEGMRVHPDYRRQGIGTEVDAGGRSYARAHGCRVARLATSMKNLPAQAALGPQGYVLVARTAGWISAPLDDQMAVPRVADERDLNWILEQWNLSAARKACRGLVPDPRWRWTELTRERLLDQVRADQIRIGPNGFGISVASNGDQDVEFNIHALVGDLETNRTLALEARREAGVRGFSRLEALVADDPEVESGLSAAGFTREGGMLVYEQAL